MIHIYTLNLSLLFFILTKVVFASEDIGTYCFDKNVSVSMIQDKISFLVKDSDRIQIRNLENCLDIYTTSSRIKLFEKMIWKIHSPIISKEEMPDGTLDHHCRIEFIETRTKKNQLSEIKIGAEGVAKKTDADKNEVSKTELLIIKGKRGQISIAAKNIEIECMRTATDLYQLIFLFEQVGTASLKSSVYVKLGESVNIGEIKNELEKNSKSIGIPSGEIINNKEIENIKYELKVL